MPIYFDTEDFEYYLMLASALKGSLEKKKQRNICEKWIKLLERSSKFCDDNSKVLGIYVLKLLLVSLKSNLLIGPFKKSPKINDETNISKIIKYLKEIISRYNENDIVKIIMKENYEKEPLLREDLPIKKLCYSIFQQIDNFGGHYYTTGPYDPISSLNDLDDKIIPIGVQCIVPKLCKKPEKLDDTPNK